MTDQLTLSSMQCPFCNMDNSCQVQSALTCWCNDVTVPAGLLALVPESLQHKTCICVSCIERFHQDPEAFAAS